MKREEDRTQRTAATKLSGRQWKRLEAVCDQRGCSPYRIVKTAVLEYLDRHATVEIEKDPKAARP